MACLMTVIILRSESNGISATCELLASNSLLWICRLAAATSNAPSVGSPRTDHTPSRSCKMAPLHRTADSSKACRPGERSGRGSSPSMKSPSGAYPSPRTTIVRSPAYRRVTVISFLVRVPVLSVQMTVVAPRVSTAGNRRISACLSTMRVTPRASVMVTIAGRPSGMAATARLTAVRNISTSGSPRSTPSPNTSDTMASAR